MHNISKPKHPYSICFAATKQLNKKSYSTVESSINYFLLMSYLVNKAVRLLWETEIHNIRILCIVLIGITFSATQITFVFSTILFLINFLFTKNKRKKLLTAADNWSDNQFSPQSTLFAIKVQSPIFCLSNVFTEQIKSIPSYTNCL